MDFGVYPSAIHVRKKGMIFMSQEKNPSNESMEELDRAEALPETTIEEKTEEKAAEETKEEN